MPLFSVTWRCSKELPSTILATSHPTHTLQYVSISPSAPRMLSLPSLILAHSPDRNERNGVKATWETGKAQGIVPSSAVKARGSQRH